MKIFQKKRRLIPFLPQKTLRNPVEDKLIGDYLKFSGMTNMKDKLIEDYKNTITHQQKAEIESKVWELHPDKSSIKREDYLMITLKGHRYDIVQRASLYNSGKNAEILFYEVDEENMPLGTATRLLRESKARVAALKVSLEESIKSVLEEYKKNNVTTKTKEGKIFRHRSASHFRSIDSIRTGYNGGDNKYSSRKKDSQNALWLQIRDILSTEIAKRLIGVDKSVAEDLWNKIETDLRIVLDTASQKIYALRCRELSGKGITVSKVSRADFIHACRILHMDPPKQGTLVDMKLARKMKYKLASIYHPDKNGGIETNRDIYEEVIKAFETLEQYSQSLTG